jgi:hypothetical protein
MNLTKFSALFIILAFTLQTYAAGYSTDQGLIKINSEAAKGECLPPFDSDPNSVLRQNNVEIYTAQNRPSVKGGSGCQSLDSLPSRSALSNPADPRLASLARVVSTLSTLGSGTMTAHKNINIVFGTVRGPSRQCGDHIQLNPGTQNCLGLGTTVDSDPHGGTSNVALIAHEIGHQIANANEQKNFSDYKAFVQPGCSITSYAVKGSGTPRGEEFAEVLAAYVTNPGMFNGAPRGCEKAFEFMADLFGETPANGHTINQTCESRRASRPSLTHNVPMIPSGNHLQFNGLPALPTPTTPSRLRFSPRYYQTVPTDNKSAPTDAKTVN